MYLLMCVCVSVMTSVTFEQCVHAYVAEGEADDRGLVQVGSDGGLEWQEPR